MAVLTEDNPKQHDTAWMCRAGLLYSPTPPQSLRSHVHLISRPSIGELWGAQPAAAAVPFVPSLLLAPELGAEVASAQRAQPGVPHAICPCPQKFSEALTQEGTWSRVHCFCAELSDHSGMLALWNVGLFPVGLVIVLGHYSTLQSVNASGREALSRKLH